ncbi:slipin family protein [Chromobacterium phragmitis]|uniref:Slipin family protein n=1 Tax=Chromobacterium phragmitis TaxID=2202141 RepID=A0ABV0IT62_9NEIS
MKLWRTFLVKKNERGLLLRDGDFVAILQPGEYPYFDPRQRYAVEPCPLRKGRFQHALADYLREHEPALLDEHFHVVEIGDEEVGLRLEQGSLAEILPPGSRGLYWKDAAALEVRKADLREGCEVAAEWLPRLTQGSLRGNPVAGLAGVLNVQVPAWHCGVLRVDGDAPRLLQPGRYGFWRFNRELEVDLVDTRLQPLEVSGQEILTRDKVGLRINLAANWRYADVALAFAKLAKPADHVYRELQFGLRAAVGERTLDQLLEDKKQLDEVVLAHMQDKLAGFGVEVSSLGVKDVVLPGDMKQLLAQVVEAEKAAQANVIRRREETGATRSLLNTAKVMEDNPTALRLKELETLERLAERIDKISVFGGLDQLLNGLVKIKA